MDQLPILLEHLPHLLLVIFRIGGLVIFAPVLNSVLIPARVKVAISFVAGIAIYPTLAADYFANASPTLELWSLIPLLGMEVTIGVVIGFLASLPLLAIEFGGLMMGQQMGLRFARLYNPASESDSDVLGQLLFFLVFAGLLLAGGLEAMVMAVLETFHHVPIATFIVDDSLVDLICGLLIAAAEVGLRVAAPVLAAVFIQSVAMGFITKTTPQINILSLGFPLRIIFGLSMAWLALGTIYEVSMEEIWSAFGSIYDWIEARGHEP